MPLRLDSKRVTPYPNSPFIIEDASIVQIRSDAHVVKILASKRDVGIIRRTDHAVKKPARVDTLIR